MIRSLVLLAFLVMISTSAFAQELPSGLRLDAPDTQAALATGLAGRSDAEGNTWYRLAMKLGRHPRFRHKIAKVINARGGYLDRKINAILLKKEWAHTDIPRLNVVAPNLIRGGQPTEAGFARLKSLGVTMVVNLRFEDDDEEPLVRRLGMTPVWLPIPDTCAPTRAQVDKLHELLARPDEKIYVHCSAGIFRTGTMVGSWRLKKGMGWDQTLAEMKAIGFDPEWLAADTEVEFLRKYAATLRK